MCEKINAQHCLVSCDSIRLWEYMWHDSRTLENFLLITWLMGVYIHLCILYTNMCVICIICVLYRWVYLLYAYIILYFYSAYRAIRGLPQWLNGKNSTCNTEVTEDSRFNPWVGMILWRRAWEFMPGKSHWIEGPGRLQSMCLQTFRHDWSDLKHTEHTAV